MMSDTKQAVEDLAPHIELMVRLKEQVVSGEVPEAEVRELPVTLFTDKPRLEQELKKAFYKRPVIVGHVSMIPNVGDHFTHDDLDKPLLVVRGKDKKVRTFLNVCRHRGMRLVQAPGKEGAPSFVCPYHQWAYDLDGRLRHIPLKDSFGEIDMDCHGLNEVRCIERHGLIWVQLNDASPIDVQVWLDSIDEDLEAFGLREHVVVHRSSTVKKANWKLIIEAFEDGYHVVRLHKKTVGQFFLDAQAATSQAGEHIRSAVARKEIQEILDAPTDDFDARRHASFSHFIFPNTITVLHPDYTSVLTLFPISVEETRVVHLFMAPQVPQTSTEKEHVDRSFDLIENGVFQSEDYFVCEGIQAGLSSGANETLLTGKHERNLLLFHDILEAVVSG